MSATIDALQNSPGFEGFAGLDEFNNFCEDIKAGKIQIIRLTGNSSAIDPSTVIAKLAAALSPKLAQQSLIRFEIQNYPLSKEICGQLMQALEGCRKLTRLMLVNCQIDDNGANAVAQLLRTTNSVRELGLNENQIGPNGGKALAEAIIQNKTLRNFYILSNQLKIEGVSALLNALIQSPEIEQMGLDHNDLLRHEVFQLARDMEISDLDNLRNELFWRDNSANQNAQRGAMILHGLNAAVSRIMPNQGFSSSSQGLQSAINDLTMNAALLRSHQDTSRALDTLTDSIIKRNQSKRVSETPLQENTNVVHSEVEEKHEIIDRRNLTSVNSAYTKAYQEGEALFQSGKYARATLLFGTARERAYNNLQVADCHTKIGHCYMERRSEHQCREFGKYNTLAIKEFRKSIALLEEEQLDIALFASDIEKNKSLITQCEGELNWRNASALDNQGNITKAKDLYEIAAQKFLSINKFGEAISCYVNAALCCCNPKINQLEEADALCQRARSIVSSNPNQAFEHGKKRITEIENHIKILRYNKLYQQGVAELMANKPDVAIVSFTRALSHAPTKSEKAQCELSIAVCLEDQGKISAARQQYELSYNTLISGKDEIDPDIIRQHKEALDEIRVKEKAYLETLNQKNAQAHLSQENEPLVHELSRTNQSSSQADSPQESKSSSVTKPIRISQPSEAFNTLFEKGKKAYSEKKFDEALLLFDKALKISSLDPFQQSNCYLGIARCLTKMEDFEKAIKNYKLCFNTRKQVLRTSHEQMKSIKQECHACIKLKREFSETTADTRKDRKSMKLQRK